MSGDTSSSRRAAATPDIHPISFNETLGCLRQQGIGLFGWCIECAKLYRMDAPAEKRVVAFFDIDLDALIAARWRSSRPARRMGATASHVRLVGRAKANRRR